MLNPDDLYDAATAADRNDYHDDACSAAAKIRTWCQSTEAKEYEPSAVEHFRSFANLLTLRHGPLCAPLGEKVGSNAQS